MSLTAYLMHRIINHTQQLVTDINKMVNKFGDISLEGLRNKLLTGYTKNGVITHVTEEEAKNIAKTNDMLKKHIDNVISLCKFHNEIFEYTKRCEKRLSYVVANIGIILNENLVNRSIINGYQNIEIYLTNIYAELRDEMKGDIKNLKHETQQQIYKYINIFFVVLMNTQTSAIIDAVKLNDNGVDTNPVNGIKIDLISHNIQLVEAENKIGLGGLYKQIRKKLVKKTPVNKFAAKITKRINEQVVDPSESYNYDELIKQIELRISKIQSSIKMQFLDLKIHIVDYDVTLNEPDASVNPEYDFMLSSYKTYFPILMIVGKKEQMDDMLSYNRLIISNISRERGINLTVENDFMTKENKFQGVLIYKDSKIEDELDKIESQGNPTFAFHDKILEYMNVKHDNMIKNLTKAYFTSDEIEDIIDYIDNMDKYWFVYDLLQIILAVGMRTQFQKYRDVMNEEKSLDKQGVPNNFNTHMQQLLEKAAKILGQDAINGFSPEELKKPVLEPAVTNIGFSAENKGNFSHHLLYQHIRLIIFMCDTVYKKYGSKNAETKDIYKYFLIRIKNNFSCIAMKDIYIAGFRDGVKSYNFYISYIDPYAIKKDDVKHALILFEPTLIFNNTLRNAKITCKLCFDLNFSQKVLLDNEFQFDTLDTKEGGSYTCDIFNSTFIQDHIEYYDIVIVTNYRKYKAYIPDGDILSLPWINLIKMVNSSGYIQFGNLGEHSNDAMYEMLRKNISEIMNKPPEYILYGCQEHVAVKKVKSYNTD